jgi:GntR family transcriptional regulator, gluconate operon transcriptional repressor
VDELVQPIRQISLGEQIARDLRLRIVSRSLLAGTSLVEGSLAVEYDVSRGPVREALRELQDEGLVASMRRGTVVVGLSDSDIEELLSLRGAIESLAVARAINTATAEDWAKLAEQIGGMRDAAGRRNPHDFAIADMAFHGALYTISGHRRVCHVWSLYAKTFTAILQLSKSPDDLDAAVLSHEALLDVFRSRDEQEAQRAIAQHLEGTRHLFLSGLQSLDRPADERLPVPSPVT